MLTFIRYILIPLSAIYAIIVWTRNRLYDFNILRSRSFTVPTIVIGNLAIGGTGKSPMTEFIVSHLRKKYKIATLSRGYGRKTKGFRYVKLTSRATDVGDEPLQFKNKFPNITVAVCEDRCKGIDILDKTHQVIILDDAYQHRKLKPLINILLFDYVSFQHPMFVLPTGNFRDLLTESKRAHFIIITKCPPSIPENFRKRIIAKIRQYNLHASISFTSITYYTPIDQEYRKMNLIKHDILLVTGISNPQPLLKFVKQESNTVQHITFKDHHNYTQADINTILSEYLKMNSDNKFILTTEKDFQRLKTFQHEFKSIPLYYIPIGICFHDTDDEILFCNKLSENLKKVLINTKVC